MLQKALRSRPVNLVFSSADGLFDGESDQLISARIVECGAPPSQAPDNPGDILTKPMSNGNSYEFSLSSAQE
ncbi:MAG TPA: hypothetical protein PKY22_02060, partial [Accumulibacter sp.]|nr:hypothetical protein [Accumulibacter sp.]